MFTKQFSQITQISYIARQLARTIYYELPFPLSFKRLLLRHTLGLRSIFKLPVISKYPQPLTCTNDQQVILSNLQFPYSEKPELSIIIPCYGQISHTINCLASLQMHPPSCNFEVIVVDDASPTNEYNAFERIKGVRLIRNDSNQGFLLSCNLSAKIATGIYLYFLNNDTQLLPGSIDELLNTFKLFPRTGIAGSRLIYPDGRLQEAGGIIWKDGSATNIGRFASAQKPEYSHLREVDYCSGASLIIPRLLFLEDGGFDISYVPAYYEDTDLAMRIRSRGYLIHYQPLSTVVHYEGISNGRFENAGVKRYQQINQEIFQRKWQSELNEHHTWRYQILDTINRNNLGRVLVVDTSVPRPDRDAGSLCIYNLMMLFRGLGYQPSFYADDGNSGKTAYTQLCEGAGIEMLSAPFTRSLRRHLIHYGHQYDLVVLSRPNLCHERLSIVRRYCTKARIIYYPHDLHYRRFEREAAVKRQKSMLKRAEQFRQIELSNSQQADITVVLSKDEQNELRRLLPDSRIHLLPLIIRDSEPQINLPCHKPKPSNIIFIGNFQHSPNEDALLWFVKDCLPLVLESYPSAVLHVVGGNPTPSVRDLNCPSIKLNGYIEDLDGFLKSMHVSIVPLRYGAGVKGKLATAMRAAIPVVSTTIGVEGIPARDREHLLVADSANEMASAIIQLLMNCKLRDQLGEAGRKFANEQWGEVASFLKLKTILSRLGLNSGELPISSQLPFYPLKQARWPGSSTRASR